jgi:hypothetical protein
MSNVNKNAVARVSDVSDLQSQVAELQAKIEAMQTAVTVPNDATNAALVAALDRAIGALATSAPRARASKAVKAVEHDAFREACRLMHLSPGEGRGRIFRELFNRGEGEYTVREISDACSLDPTNGTIAAMFGKVSGHSLKYPDAGCVILLVNERGAFANGSISYKMREGFVRPGERIALMPSVSEQAAYADIMRTAPVNSGK